MSVPATDGGRVIYTDDLLQVVHQLAPCRLWFALHSEVLTSYRVTRLRTIRVHCNEHARTDPLESQGFLAQGIVHSLLSMGDEENTWLWITRKRRNLEACRASGRNDVPMLTHLPTFDRVHDAHNAATARRKWAAKFVVIVAMSLGLAVVLAIVTMRKKSATFHVVAAPAATGLPLHAALVPEVAPPADATAPGGAPKSVVIQLDEVTVVGRLSSVR